MARIIVSLSLIALVFSISACAQIFSPRRVVRGTVTDGREPVAGARISIDGVDSMLTTNADGVYEYCCVPDSMLTLRASTTGYAETVRHVRIAGEKEFNIPLCRMESVGTGGELFGKVCDEDGKPIVGATIRLLGTKLVSFAKAPDGRFRVTGIPPGVYTVQTTRVWCDSVTTEIVIDSLQGKPFLLFVDTIVLPLPKRLRWFCGPRSVIVREQAATVRSSKPSDPSRAGIFGGYMP